MTEILRLSWPIAAVLAFSLSTVAVRRWWQEKGRRKADGEQVVALTRLAASLGGEVVGADRAAAWSAELRGPLANQVDGIGDRLLRRSAPRFDLALDFRRGPWHVRVSQASMRQQNSNDVGVLAEHRFEVATARLAPMRLTRRRHTDFRGRPVLSGHLNGWVGEQPSTVVRERAKWLPLQLPPGADHEFVALASDLSTAAGAFNVENLEWLVGRLDLLPPLIGTYWALTFENGLVYASMPERIDPDTMLLVADTICGLLDRMSDAKPRHPAAAV